MKIVLVILAVCLLISFVWAVEYNERKKAKKAAQEALELKIEMEGLKDVAAKYEKIQDTNEWWEPCPRCIFFDGYDMCLRRGIFGSVTNDTKAYCETHNLFKEIQT